MKSARLRFSASVTKEIQIQLVQGFHRLLERQMQTHHFRGTPSERANKEVRKIQLRQERRNTKPLRDKSRKERSARAERSRRKSRLAKRSPGPPG